MKVRKLIRWLFIICILVVGWFYVNAQFDQNGMSIKDEISSFINKEEFSKLYTSFQSFFQKLENELTQDNQTKNIEKPVLEEPEQQVFSVYNVEIGNAKSEVEAAIGTPQRVSFNEYGKNWFTYHENYYNYISVMYDENDKVVGLYTNQDLITSSIGITLNSSKDEVRQQLGEPMTGMRKGLVVYQYQPDDGFDVFQLNNSYVTIFYDVHEEDTVTAIQIIEVETEKEKSDYYTAASEELRQGFEYQLFDLTNAARVVHQLSVLTWDDAVRETARDHSLDMAENNYFSHTNLRGQSPFERMEEDKLRYTMAGENLAYGQTSSIFAHEGLMNSWGHRENILQSKYEYLGVGVAFNKENHPYYTENFYKK
ncbi:serine protease [Bacillus sp. AGMB 02131]|uniref:Serine protease n=1 Tax=Peribacillus faecalis TaxID=2772559 RepID=A0A927CYP8_9BACI|nr:CAP-associated domain-containing protein [Peribacillus faecalis]MBD3110116.1 serine protease [Peribacillus faecalis]